MASCSTWPSGRWLDASGRSLSQAPWLPATSWPAGRTVLPPGPEPSGLPPKASAGGRSSIHPERPRAPAQSPRRSPGPSVPRTPPSLDHGAAVRGRKGWTRRRTVWWAAEGAGRGPGGSGGRVPSAGWEEPSGRPRLSGPLPSRRSSEARGLKFQRSPRRGNGRRAFGEGRHPAEPPIRDGVSEMPRVSDGTRCAPSRRTHPAAGRALGPRCRHRRVPSLTAEQCSVV